MKRAIYIIINVFMFAALNQYLITNLSLMESACYFCLGVFVANLALPERNNDE